MDIKTAALLNANDPERLRVEQESCQTPEGRAAWLSAVQEAEQLRMNLKNVSVTQDAVTRALQIGRRRSNTKSRAYINGVAAAIALSIGTTYVLVQQQSDPKIMTVTYDNQEVRKIELKPEVKQIALLAMENFENRGLALTTADNVDTLFASLPVTSRLPKRVPELAPLQQLNGGKMVEINREPALLTRWSETMANGEIHDMVLQQLYAKELNLPADMNPVLVHVGNSGKTPKPACDVLLWTHEGIAYMLVSESSDGCARRALQALKQKMGPDYPVSPTA